MIPGHFESWNNTKVPIHKVGFREFTHQTEKRVDSKSISHQLEFSSGILEKQTPPQCLPAQTKEKCLQLVREATISSLGQCHLQSWYPCNNSKLKCRNCKRNCIPPHTSLMASHTAAQGIKCTHQAYPPWKPVPKIRSVEWDPNHWIWGKTGQPKARNNLLLKIWSVT